MASFIANFDLHLRPEGLGSTTVNAAIRHDGFRRLGFLAVLLLSVISSKADPIDIGESPVFQFGTIFAITAAILLEVVCIWLLLRRKRTPRLFILWLMGMHLLTYPIFLGLLWLAIGVHPALAAATGEGLIVLIEGSLIYLICRFAPSPRVELPRPSVVQSLFVSLAGNICSAVAFPLLTMLNGFIAYSMAAASQY